MKNTELRSVKILVIIVFIIYILATIYFLFFSEEIGRGVSTGDYHYNLVPFKEITRYFENANAIGPLHFLMNIAGNIIWFIPFGLLLPLIHKSFRNVIITVVTAAAFSLIVEALQLITKVGSFDVDDILMNTIGGFIGILLFHIIKKTYNKHKCK